MPETIYFNGKKYESVTEMPPNERQMYEKFDRFFADANQDGVPDAFQANNLAGLKDVFGAIKDIAQMSSTTQGLSQEQFSVIRETDVGISINGKEFKSVAEMPPQIRQVYEKITKSAQEGSYNIFDENWREVQRDEFFQPHDDEIINRQFSKRPPTALPSLETVDSNSRLALLVVVALLFIGVLAFAWFAFF
jgi:hypothetical protein